MIAAELATQDAGVLAATVLTELTRNIQVSGSKSLNIE